MVFTICILYYIPSKRSVIFIRYKILNFSKCLKDPLTKMKQQLLGHQDRYNQLKAERQEQCFYLQSDCYIMVKVISSE